MDLNKLKKEAERNCVDDTHYCLGGFGGNAYCEGYLASAEPREKQIEIDAEQIRALQKQNGELTDKVKELEAQIEKMKCCYNCKHSRTEYEHCRTDKHEKWEIKEND